MNFLYKSATLIAMSTERCPGPGGPPCKSFSKVVHVKSHSSIGVWSASRLSAWSRSTAMATSSASPRSGPITRRESTNSARSSDASSSRLDGKQKCLREKCHDTTIFGLIQSVDSLVSLQKKFRTSDMPIISSYMVVFVSCSFFALARPYLWLIRNKSHISRSTITFLFL